MGFLYFLKRGTSKTKFAACAALLVVAALIAGFVTVNHVKITVDGSTNEVTTLQSDPKLILQMAGINLGAKDEYRFINNEKGKMEIVVYRAVPVIIEHEGNEKEVITAKHTVGELLDELGYDRAKYQSDPGADTKIHKDLYISFYQKEAAEETASKAHYYIETSRGAVRYVDYYIMEATAYLPSDGDGEGITATGLEARHGIVAVDPDVIPLGTRLYIPGYGFAIAADTGGAINGEIIDLCMESYDEAMEFGRRDVEVFVLEG